jgi:monofunctional glycosyltransferase
VILSIGWVLAYRFVPVPFTWPMARDAIQGKHVERDWVPCPPSRPPCRAP